MLINFDEGGIQYKSVPMRSYVDSKKVVNAKKPVRSRITVMVGASMNGHKFKLFIIGNAARPRALSNVNLDTLPVHYYHSKNAWMTSHMFTHW